jgi:uncharacterized membrane protein
VPPGELSAPLTQFFFHCLFTGVIGKALKIGFIEFFTKIILYYIHERIWWRLSFGTKENVVNGKLKSRELHSRSVLKGIAWRALGSLDTFWIVYFVNRDSVHAVQTAFYITSTEILTKIFLFWLHERSWMKIKWGRR